MVKNKIPVRDAMTRHVITITPEETIDKIAKLMLKHDVGSVIVVDNNQPIGIVTEKDFVELVAKKKNPDQLVKSVMSSPLLTISPNHSILEAAKMMQKSKTRKLPVIKNDKMVGIITAEDIARVAPKEIELLLELVNIKVEDMGEFRQSSTEGVCEACGNYSEYLHTVGGTSVCAECKETMRGETED